jgi:hypothetical protein
MKQLRVILVKPSKYGIDGYVQRFKKGFMPNATLNQIASLTPRVLNNHKIIVHLIDEYVWCSTKYFEFFRNDQSNITLVAIVGVQSHQFQRALDLGVYAKSRGVEHCIVGGPHVMTCDTSIMHEKGLSFSLSEAENVWLEVLVDATQGELKPSYGADQRWTKTLEGTVITPPSKDELNRYWAPMLGLYPVRGCPYSCNFCSVIKISGRQVRSESIDTTLQSLRMAKQVGINTIMFVSDNFNKYPDAKILLEEMIKANLGIRYFCQCDTQIAKQPDFIELLGRSNCFEVFVGVESFDRNILKSVDKNHNDPDTYSNIISACEEFGIRAHFSNIVGFPNQTKEEIDDHMDCLKQLKPKVASFYIFTPIPGTDQYDEFRQNNLICENNLDRFDATYPTFRHPNFSRDELIEKLYKCYVQYNRFLLRNVNLDDETKRLAIFNRFTAENHMHPMAGGIDQVKVDRAEEYRTLRKQFFNIDSVPLPTSMKLSRKDAALNRAAKL